VLGIQLRWLEYTDNYQTIRQRLQYRTNYGQWRDVPVVTEQQAKEELARAKQKELNYR